MLVQTTRFGPVEIDIRTILNFKEGLLGFEEQKRFAIINCETTEPIKWLQCIDESYLSLPIIDPFIIKPDYQADVDSAELMSIGLPSENEILIFNAMVVPDDITQTTVNLCAPILINNKTGEARQIVMERTEENPIKYPAFKALAEYYVARDAELAQKEGTPDAGAHKKG